MANKPRWVQTAKRYGTTTITFRSWRTFVEFINQKFLEYNDYIFRGQASNNWKLDTGLDRALRTAGLNTELDARSRHFSTFRAAARGRRGSNPAEITAENEWWALGQHSGLLTPLLDWTESPFVAAYFAFAEELPSSKTDHRVVFAIHKPTVEHMSSRIAKRHRRKTRPPIVEVIEPQSNENARLLSQRGLFTRLPDGVGIEEWLRTNRKLQSGKGAILIKFLIPDRDRLAALRSLNRMNINSLSLFPDLLGASQFCNMTLMIDSY